MKSTLIAFLLFISQLTFARIPVPGKNTYVNDYAGVLKPEQITSLNQSIFDLEKLHNVQLAVVLIDKIPADYTIKKFAVEIGQQWHIGKDQRGIVYVAAISQHKQSLQVGENLSSIFTPDQSQDVLKELKSSFRKKDYKAGLDILVDDINNVVPVSNGYHKAQASEPQQLAVENQPTDNAENATNIGVIFIVALAIIIIVVINIRSRNKRIAVTNPQNPMNYPGYYDVPPVNNGYGNQGYYQQPDHTLRDIATGVAVGAAAAYVADSLMNDQINDNYAQQQFDDNNNVGFDDNFNNNDFDDNNSFDDNTSQRNDSGGWGDWGGGDSSGDSGFSDSSDSGGSSDW